MRFSNLLSSLLHRPAPANLYSLLHFYQFFAQQPCYYNWVMFLQKSDIIGASHVFWNAFWALILLIHSTCTFFALQSKTCAQADGASSTARSWIQKLTQADLFTVVSTQRLTGNLSMIMTASDVCFCRLHIFSLNSVARATDQSIKGCCCNL